MTISSTTRTAGPFTGDGVAGSFPFNFKVFAAADLVVVQTIAGVDSTLVLGTDYGVTLNADQNAAPGGALISKVAGVNTPLTTGYIWNATSNVSNLQPVKLTNNGGFFPAVINDALDRLTILVQQTVRAVAASLQYPLSDGSSISNILPNKAARLGKVLAFDPTTGAPIMSNQTLAALEAGSATATAQAAIATAAAATSTTQAGISTTQAGISTGAAATSTAQAALALGYANASLNAAGYAFTYLTNTAASDPGAGGLKFNNATLASATACYISETSALAQAIAAVIATWDDSTNTIHSQFKMVKLSDPSAFALFNITGTITDNGTWDTITVAYVSGNGTFANNDAVFVQNARTGDLGAPGAGIVAGGTAGGTANALTFTPTPAIGSYTIGTTLTGIIATTNTGSPTVNVSGVAATSIRKSIGGALVALVAGDLQAGVTETFVYDGTFWVLQTVRAYAQGADIASTASINFDTSTGDYFNVTGTTGITGITLQQGREVTSKFAGILTITNGANVINLSGANITTAAGDVAVWRGEASGVVRMISYMRASGAGLVTPATGLIGAVNAKSSITAASATATFTAGEVITETTLGGAVFKLANYSQSVNLAATGAGGMDTGAAPASGFVSVYAIYNPTTLTTSILACNATTSAGETYTGANMPSGYTASALLAIAPTNGSSQFQSIVLFGRKVYRVPVSVLNTASPSSASWTSVSLSTAVPPTAKTASFVTGVNVASASNFHHQYAADTNGISIHEFCGYVNANMKLGNFNSCGTITDFPIITAQTMYYKSFQLGDNIECDVIAYTF